MFLFQNDVRCLSNFVTPRLTLSPPALLSRIPRIQAIRGRHPVHPHDRHRHPMQRLRRVLRLARQHCVAYECVEFSFTYTSALTFSTIIFPLGHHLPTPPSLRHRHHLHRAPPLREHRPRVAVLGIRLPGVDLLRLWRGLCVLGRDAVRGEVERGARAERERGAFSDDDTGACLSVR